MKTITTAIRAVMRNHGKINIFTNKYEKCRTVKVYGTVNECACKAIQDIAKRANKDITIKTKPSPRWCGAVCGGVVTIVRIPGSSKRDNLFM